MNEATTVEGYEMPFCRKCGVELLPDDKFCPNCGATYTPVTPRQAATEGKAAAEVVEPAKVVVVPQPAPEPANETRTATAAPAQAKHTKQGYASIFMGIVGLVVFFIPITPSDKQFVLIIDMFVGAIAGAWGSKAQDLGDKYGLYGLLLAAIVVILCVIGFLV